jgi:hypothetical protein
LKAANVKITAAAVSSRTLVRNPLLTGCAFAATVVFTEVVVGVFLVFMVLFSPLFDR